VHGVGCADGVRFPDVDLSAAAAIFASASIDISLAWLPVFSVGLAIDELEVMRALGITTTQTVRSTVVRVLLLPSSASICSKWTTPSHPH